MNNRSGCLMSVVVALCVALFLGGVVYFVIQRTGQSVLASRPLEEVFVTDANGQLVVGPEGQYYPAYSGNPGAVQVETAKDTGEEVYYISGLWIWNESLPAMDYDIEQPLNVTVDDGEFIAVILAKFPSGWHLKYAAYDAKGIAIGFSEMTDGFDGRPQARIMDCGTEPQPVSKEFYEYLNANAVPAEKSSFDEIIAEQIENDKTYTISGVWEWNETISVPDNYRNLLNVDINFTSAGVQWTKFIAQLSCDESLLVYQNEEGWPDAYWGNWEDEAYRIIDFGSEQEISSEVYHYITANAKPVTQ